MYVISNLSSQNHHPVMESYELSSMAHLTNLITYHQAPLQNFTLHLTLLFTYRSIALNLNFWKISDVVRSDVMNYMPRHTEFHALTHVIYDSNSNESNATFGKLST